QDLGRHLDIGQSPFPRGKSGVSLRPVLSNAPEQAGTGGSRLPALGWEPLWGRSLLAMGIPVDRPMIGGGSLLAMRMRPHLRGVILASSSINGVLFPVLGGPRIQSLIDGPSIELPDLSNSCCLPGRTGGTPIIAYGASHFLLEALLHASSNP